MCCLSNFAVTFLFLAVVHTNFLNLYSRSDICYYKSTSKKIVKNGSFKKFFSNSRFRKPREINQRLTAFNNDYRAISENQCLQIPVFSNVCPFNLQQLHTDDGRILCYIVKTHQPFPPKCPYLHFLTFFEIRDILSIYFPLRSVWLHAFRNLTDGFANFEWTEPGSEGYGTSVSKEIVYSLNKNCLIYKYLHIVRVSCSEKHDTICLYSASKLKESAQRICTSYGYNQCIPGSYNLLLPMCFCLRFKSEKLEKQMFCEKLAEPIYPYQSELLIQDFSKYRDTCWIGFYKAYYGSYKWWSSQTAVNYTRWKNGKDTCKFSEGAIQFGNRSSSGWILVEDKSVKCAVCEFALKLKVSSLHLQYVIEKDQLELTIRNVSSVWKVYCFTDADKVDLKQPVAIFIDFAWKEIDSAIAKLDIRIKYPGYYWCEGFQYNTENIIKSNNVLIANKKYYKHEFVAYIMIKLFFREKPDLENYYLETIALISKQILNQCKGVIVRPMRRFLNKSLSSMFLLIHITTKRKFEAIDTEYTILNNILNSISNITVMYFRNSEVCFFDITYTSDNSTLEWPQTRIGATVVPINKLCLDKTQNMLPVTRKCEGDFLYGAKWASPEGDCYGNTTYSEVTEKLFVLTKSNTTATEKAIILGDITKESVSKEPIDIYLIATVLEDLSTPINIINADSLMISRTINNVMNFDRHTLQKAQSMLNSTDKILAAVDNFMKHQSSLSIVLPKLIVYVSDIKTNGIVGLALYNSNLKNDNFQLYDIVELYQNTSFEGLLLNDNLETAVLVPSNITFNIQNASNKLIIIIYQNDILFLEKHNSSIIRQSKTNIVNVLIPGFSGALNNSIKMAFRMPRNYTNPKSCSYWDYGLNENMISIYGKWKIDTPNKRQNNLETCEFLHMTHFGLLLHGNLEESSKEKLILEYLTIIGSSLSLIGVILILITSIFKTWRNRPGNIILISYCFVIILQVIFLYSSGAIKNDGTACKVVGAFIHYITISEFCWMFVIAILQYRRFVLVFQPYNENIVKWCLLFGWGFPLIPVIIAISISFDNYRMNEKQFCTIQGYPYVFLYLLPIFLILFMNLILFVRIIYSVSRQNIETSTKSRHNHKLEILLGLFLFFALGLTWIFGIIGISGGGIVFNYLFCITATLRGLILFLFFIIGNKETRNMWHKKYRYYFNRKLNSKSAPSSSNTTVSSAE